jgi:hypothetical protein
LEERGQKTKNKEYFTKYKERKFKISKSVIISVLSKIFDNWNLIDGTIFQNYKNKKDRAYIKIK